MWFLAKKKPRCSSGFIRSYKMFEYDIKIALKYSIDFNSKFSRCSATFFEMSQNKDFFYLIFFPCSGITLHYQVLSWYFGIRKNYPKLPKYSHNSEIHVRFLVE